VDLFSSHHTLTPPTQEDEQLAWLRLLRSRRVGIATFFRLLHGHGSATAALAALPGVASAAGVSGYRICPLPVVQKEMRAARKAGAKLVCYGDDIYPAALTEIPDPPPLFWALGDTGLLSRPMVALVGARNASSLGTRMAKKLAGDLSEQGYVVVSGLARGVDAAAHGAAVSGGTIAVQAGGVDVIYPIENTQLAETIAGQGLRLSEDPIGLQPQARHFPKRNRIISGLSQALVVVEAAARSGSLITARNALDQGRDVMAVPGHPFDGRAAGCNMLIRDGATLVRSARDVIEALPQVAERAPDQDAPPQQPRTAATADLRDANRLHNEILQRLGPSPLAEDQLIRDLNLPAQRVSPELVSLELDGKIVRAPGGLLSLV